MNQLAISNLWLYGGIYIIIYMARAKCSIFSCLFVAIHAIRNACCLLMMLNTAVTGLALRALHAVITLNTLTATLIHNVPYTLIPYIDCMWLNGAHILYMCYTCAVNCSSLCGGVWERGQEWIEASVFIETNT